MGDAVNVASLAESYSEPGKILITEACRSLLPDKIFVAKKSGISLTLPDGTVSDTFFLQV